MSLRNQLLAVFAALFTAVLVAIWMVSVSGTRQYLVQQLASHAQDAATALSVNLGQSLGSKDLVLAEAQVASLFDRGYFKRIEVLGTDRKPLVQKQMPAKIEGVPAWYVELNPIETPVGEAFVGSGWKQLGKVLVESQPTFAYQHLWRSSLQLLATLLVIWGSGLLLLLAMLHYLLKPLRAIERAALAAQSKQFEQISPVPGAPELGSVVLAMNQMSRKLGDMLEADTAKAQALYGLAYQDEVTQLVNRRGYELGLMEWLKAEEPFELAAVLAVELDDMRLLLRSHGYPHGDHILKTIADLARTVLQPVPAKILARSNEFGFSFVLAGLPPEQFQKLAQTLREQVDQELAQFEPARMTVIHFGLAYFHSQATRSEVFARADLAVETARQSGGNAVAALPDAPDPSQALGSQAWRRLIHTALTEKRWRLVRQPVVDLKNTGIVLQLECMSRLLDEQDALVPASIFMPMALRHRLMTDVDRAVVSLALHALRNDSSGPATLALNLSSQSIANQDFIAWFDQQLDSFAALGKRVAVEVSEATALRNKVAVLNLRVMVRRHQGQLGVDHFGADPQALTMLRELLPDYVKLSAYLLETPGPAEPERAVLESIVTLAHALEIVVIAQSVETPVQAQALLAAGVDAAQGMLFGAPG